MRRQLVSIKVVLAATVLFQMSLNVSSSWATGALTLQENGTIDLTSGNGGSDTVVQTFNFASGTVADITATTGADGSDRLFATNPSLTSNDLRFVQFTDESDTNFAIGEMIPEDNAYYELAAAPEPATWVAAAMTLLTMAVTQRRRLALLRSFWR